MSKNKKEAPKLPEVITTHVTRVERVYMVPTTQGMTLDLHVELACGGFAILSGFTSFSDKRPVQVLKSDIMYRTKEEKEECLEKE